MIERHFDYILTIPSLAAGDPGLFELRGVKRQGVC